MNPSSSLFFIRKRMQKIQIQMKSKTKKQKLNLTPIMMPKIQSRVNQLLPMLVMKMKGKMLMLRRSRSTVNTGVFTVRRSEKSRGPVNTGVFTVRR